jgi:succinate-semialdehyde dehydrogenase/glutarate-semialdehyde dehydrogenase
MLNKIEGKNFINGEWLGADEYISVKNPADGSIVGEVPDVDDETILYAIDSAHTAQNSWKNTIASERCRLLRKWKELILENTDEIAKILTLENGKPLSEAKREVVYAADFVEWFAHQATGIIGTSRDGVKPGQKILTEYEPIGVVAAITPWNFPVAMTLRKISPALAAGCSIILKPSDLTPFSALALALLAQQAGFPDGVVNVITGDAARLGEKLCSDFRVRKLSFTGSTNIGKLLYKNSSSTLKKLSLELGGNAPFIVFEDADIETAISGLIMGKLRAAGQVCIAPNRIFLHSAIHDKFVNRLKEIFLKLKIGNGMEEGVEIGPLINQKAVTKALSLVRDALDKGANLVCGGEIVTGCLLKPTILTDCHENMSIFQEEIFAPVVPCYKFDSVDEVIERANNTDYGLASYVFTSNVNISSKLAERLDFGIVGVNTGFISNSIGAFAGRKNSGFGVEGSHLGIYEFLQTKYVCVERV